MLALEDELAELLPVTQRLALARVDVEGEIVTREASDVQAFDQLPGVEGPVVHLVSSDHPALLRVC